MKATKKVRKNQYRLDSDEFRIKEIGFMGILDLFVKATLTIVVISLISLGFIAIHDSVLQSDYFAIREISLTGVGTLSRVDVLEKAGVQKVWSEILRFGTAAPGLMLQMVMPASKVSGRARTITAGAVGEMAKQ